MPRQIQRTADIRIQNKRKIIQCLLSHDTLTKKELAMRTGLSFATVSNLTTQLKEQGIIQISSYQESEGGRNAGLLSIDEGSRLFTSLHIRTAGEVAIQVLSFKKNVLLSFTQTVQPPNGAAEIYDACAQAVRRCGLEVPGYANRNLGLGAALPGIVEKESKLLINSTIQELDGQPVLQSLAKRVHCPVYGENESNLLALAVSFSPENPKDTVYLHLDDGMGIGVICNGELLRGSHGLGGEINMIPTSFREDGCRTLEEELVFGSFVSSYCEKRGLPEPSETVFLRDAQSLATAEIREVMEEKGALLGRLIGMLDAMFDPAAFYIGGKTSLLFEGLAPFVRTAFQKYSAVKKDKQLALFPCRDYQQQLMAGCADTVFDHWDFL